jgi:hypothetical protein
VIRQLLHKIYDLPAIVQGAAGSALFWIIQKILITMASGMSRLLGHTTRIVNRDKKFREWVFRRFTSRDGLINYSYGYLYSMSRAMRGLLMGLLFSAIALLFGGSIQVIWGMCLGTAIICFIGAINWVMPSSSWNNTNLTEHWQRVAELEKELFGEADKETLRFVEHYAQEPEKAKDSSTAL